MSESHIYKMQVLADYDRKRAANQLSLEMNDPTAADLKNECLRVCEKNFDKKCKQLLGSFFEDQPDLTAYRIVIKKFGADKCKPLYLFLKDRSIDTNEKNIEMLAWLIDFQLRPYNDWLNDPERHKRTILSENDTDTKGKTEKSGIEIKKDDFPPTSEKEKGTYGFGRQKRPQIIIALILIVLLCSGGIYIMGHGETSAIPDPETLRLAALKKNPTGCMVWKQDHYITAPCNQISDTNLIVPLDTQRLAQFKKVINTSAIKMSDAGRIWYFKLHGHLECFTAGGVYPLDTNRRLLPLTQYMISKYIHPEPSNVIINR